MTNDDDVTVVARLTGEDGQPFGEPTPVLLNTSLLAEYGTGQPETYQPRGLVVDYAYAVTAHVAQGGQFNRVVVDVPCVVPDNATGVRSAVEHLLRLGHDSLTYVAGPEASWADGMRWRSLQDTAADLQLRVRRIGPFTPDVPGGVRAAEEVASSPATAVIAYNDQVAIGLIRGLGARGVSVPRHISVVGFDNIGPSELITPGLTTVASPLRQEGATATRHLLAVIEGAQSRTGAPVVLPVRLVERGSTAQRRRKSTSPASGTTKVSSSPRNASRSTAAGSR